MGSNSKSGIGVGSVDERKRGANTLTNEQFYCFQRWFGRWIEEHCGGLRSDGKPYSQRDIADRLDITQNEVSAWLNDASRPGLQRIIRLAQVTGESMDHILGLDEKRTG